MARGSHPAWMARLAFLAGATVCNVNTLTAIFAAWLTALLPTTEATYRLLSLTELCRRQSPHKPVKIEMEEGAAAVLVLDQGEVLVPYWRCDLELSAGKDQGLMVQVLRDPKSIMQQQFRSRMPGCGPMNSTREGATTTCSLEGTTTPLSSPGTRLTSSVENRLDMWPLMCLMDR